MSDYERIAQIIRYLDERYTEQPSLESLASLVGLSPFHFHRLFSQWAGITPKNFLQCLTLQKARQLLQSGRSVLDAALESGLSGPGRLHELCVQLESASPGEIKNQGQGWVIQVGLGQSPFGTILLAQSPRGICHLSFPESERKSGALKQVQTEWPRARLVWDSEMAGQVSRQLFNTNSPNAPGPWRAFVRGSEFQVKVWQALLKIPVGHLASYGSLAALAGFPKAARAVGTAVGQNPLAYLIPCHRVIRETGVIGNYRWDPVRKKAMILWEQQGSAP